MYARCGLENLTGGSSTSADVTNVCIHVTAGHAGVFIL